MKSISILVPVYNSHDILPKLLKAVDAVRIEQNWNLQLVLVDDGSRDDSFEKIRELRAEYPYIHGLKLARNFGHQNAVRTGLEHVTGDYIAIIDDDLQDPPSLLPEFFSYLDRGYHVAYGVRRKRKENFMKVFLYKSFYRILRSVSEIEIPLDTGDFCVMKKAVAQRMIEFPEKNPFLRGIRAWVGFQQIGVEYERSQRDSGESGYTFKKLFKIAFDGIFSFTSLPLKLLSVIGSLGVCLSVFYAAYITLKLLLYGVEVQGFVTLVLVILFFGSMNLLGLGILGEYLARIYDETKNRPHAVVAEILPGTL